ncbi:hypothetical protein K402DRAFT_373385 [Aulographum hederae CBS 113979]|uniref:LIM zinc-binding domain-containing protein n=1 Tax=Aulographum hederae CBS 113979 TaxID=1176131 RepID=A0A6G1H5T6_9PEZI|nr:hypothetical protein K402DRAFT_373385 [Aulographum hederae CBS 113979]
MLHRSKSKDRATAAPGPSFMSSKQVAEYLGDLRTNRPARPSGSRPPPASFSSRHSSQLKPGTQEEPPPKLPTLAFVQESHLPPRCSSAQSHRRTASTVSSSPSERSGHGRPLAQSPDDPSVQYLESGARWMERQEAHSLRRALEDMDLKTEKRVHSAAQDEAAELVWKHQNPSAAQKNPDAPYKYKEHLRQGSHSRSRSWMQTLQEEKRASIPGSMVSRASRRSTSTGSESAGSRSVRIPSDPSVKVPDSPSSPTDVSDNTRSPSSKDSPPTKDNGKTVKFSAVPSIVEFPKSRRVSSGSKRKVSGSLFINPTDQIYEEPEETTATLSESSPEAAAPAPLATRRSPFFRPVNFLRGTTTQRANTAPSVVPKLDKFEIQKNPPSQSRNAAYTANVPPPVPTKDAVESGILKLDENDENAIKMKGGKEVRGDDIRAATSMRLSDRSPKLPTPVYVSDNPGRPIVSFKQDCNEITLEEERSNVPLSRKTDEAAPEQKVANADMIERSKPTTEGTSTAPKDVFARRRALFQSGPQGSRPPPVPVVKAQSETAVRSVNVHPAPPTPKISVQGSSPLYRPQVPSAPAIPSISLCEAPHVPFTNVQPTPVPSINVQNTSSVPLISVQEAPGIPSISIHEPSSAPSISVSAPQDAGPKRPLPVPSKAMSSNRTQPRPAQWTPAGGPVPGRTGILCSNCALPISGRIVSAAGARFHPECFSCHHCAENLEAVAFYPEPENARVERLARIAAQLAGEYVEEAAGKTDIDDGDESQRFYCHLDFHEFFSPRCKSCKTPIEGEVVVALGAEWHQGHFFCAQCGDPFDSSTPFVEKDGWAWCVGCHTNRYSAKCKKCRKPVTEMVVKALGAEWHGECFCCVECSGPFKERRYFLRPGKEQDPVCTACEERRLKA